MRGLSVCPVGFMVGYQGFDGGAAIVDRQPNNHSRLEQLPAQGPTTETPILALFEAPRKPVDLDRAAHRVEARPCPRP